MPCRHVTIYYWVFMTCINTYFHRARPDISHTKLFRTLNYLPIRIFFKASTMTCMSTSYRREPPRDPEAPFTP